MARVLERTVGYYEVREVPYGKDYSWCPECVVVECDCGERLSLSGSKTVCGCGTDHVALVREELNRRGSSTPPGVESLRPEDECREWREEQDQYLRSEHNDQLEWEALE